MHNVGMETHSVVFHTWMFCRERDCTEMQSHAEYMRQDCKGSRTIYNEIKVTELL